MNVAVKNVKLVSGKNNVYSTAVTVVRLICLALFAVSAYDKFLDHERFMKGLSAVNYIGEYSIVISWMVPVVEVMVCLLLIVPETANYGLSAFGSLMGIFTIYISSMLLWAEKLPCHCNLIIEKLSFGEHLMFNLAFICLAIFGLWLNSKNSKP